MPPKSNEELIEEVVTNAQSDAGDVVTGWVVQADKVRNILRTLLTEKERRIKIDDVIDQGKARADYFEPGAEVILASTAKEQMLKLNDEKDYQLTELLYEILQKIETTKVTQDELNHSNGNVLALKVQYNAAKQGDINYIKTIAKKFGIKVK